MQKVLGPIRRVRFTRSTYPGQKRNIAWKNTSPYAIKFEDRSHEETERQERCAQSKAWDLAKNVYKHKANDKATFFSPAEMWVLPSASAREPEEKEFVFYSGASVHMVIEKVA